MELLLPYAYDDDGNLVYIDNAQKEHKYTCPNCGAALHIRKDWCNQPFLKCENLECNYKETLSDYDHILFPNMENHINNIIFAGEKR